MPAFQFITLQGNRQQRRGNLVRRAASTALRPSIDDTPAIRSADLPARRIPAEHTMLLDLFGRPPVVFHRSFVEVAGGVAAALWLSYAVSLSQGTENAAAARLTLSDEECLEATGMSSSEQAKARNDLRVLGLIQESRNGGSQSYMLDLERLSELLMERSEAAWSALNLQTGKSTSKVPQVTAA